MLTSGIISAVWLMLANTSIEPTPLEMSRAPIIVTEEAKEPELLGEFILTAYCSCEKCCGQYANKRADNIVKGASGEELIAGYSIAVDPTVIPYGTELIIGGQEYEAMDCGGDIKDNRIDVYFNSHEEAVEFGVKHVDVYQKILD